MTKNLDVVNQVLATKEASEYHLTKNYSFLHKKMQVETIAHLLKPLRQYEGQAHRKYSSTTWCSKYSSKSTAYYITIIFNHLVANDYSKHNTQQRSNTITI